jgi:GPH family glycoside/pentoside/hexuronide:cation symporter
MTAEPAPPLVEPTPTPAAPSAAKAVIELRRSKLSIPLVSAYGAGTLVDSVMSGALGLYLFYYVTQVCGLANSLAGLSIFLGLLIDSMVDPIVGSLSDNTPSRFGRRHPFMFAAALPLAILLGVIFSIPTGLHGWGLFAFVTIVAIALRICHSCFNLPYVALGAELSDDYDERTVVVGSRFLVGPIGTTAIVLLGTGFFLYGPKIGQHASYLPLGWTLGAITLVGAVIATFGTLPALKRLHQVKVRSGNAIARTWTDVVEIFRNRSFVSLFACLILIFTAAGVASVLGLHAYKFFWNLPPGMIPIVQLAAVPGLFIGAIVSLIVVPKFEKRTVVIVGLVLFAALLYALLMINAATVTFVTTGVSVAFQSAMADAADEHEHLFGTRREGLYFAGLNFSAKAAVGLGSLIAGIGLDLIHFPTAIASQPGAAAHIDPAVIKNLGLLFGPGPAVITAVAVLIFIGYRLTKAQHATIQTELNARRAASENS